MAVSSNLALEAPSVKFSPRSRLVGPIASGVHGTKFGSEDLNGAGTSVSEKVHLDEIAVSLDSHRQGRSGLMSLAAAGLVACRSRMAPI
jgi:hypothetical protein